jgi:DNA-directed RNA polymerase specialized sigma subunit
LEILELKQIDQAFDDREKIIVNMLFEGYKVSEIVKILKIPKRTLMRIISKIKKNLKK